MTMPPLYALRAFETAARLGSFSKAAAALNVTPGAVSRHVSTLESWFECRLFLRHGPKVTLTDSGTQLAKALEESFLSIERACRALRRQAGKIRLKAPSTLTMRWLLDVLQLFRQQHQRPEVEMSSLWMDRDSVDFTQEPFDCAILLGDGNFGEENNRSLLFAEWLIPLCAPGMVAQARQNLAACTLIHPSTDRRDWRRWLQHDERPAPNIAQGIVFDTLEQGTMAAMSGHGVSIGDLLLNLPAIRAGLLALPFSTAIATGEGYYFVWPKNTLSPQPIALLQRFLNQHIPGPLPADVIRQGAAPDYST
ncbi:LysR substrate-binding domain-containing protein [Klebsiella pasteurii]|uniref:LysR substrate-binding domain-containing protein n=1 Tax=Klebsiella TaxID=570 RepID=UPI000665306E|nr:MULTISPECIES: LysR substrate-binding domain-containing protein [Klebsiella]MBZ7663830.1 LysR family transcriptional regulator [Klebsiella grimontii]MDH0310301.1 LysR substrate-binding domain-containing protein [Klebsiella pasteurii]MEC6163393.1 LysR substrate-binding domain-containing protein [Klebsiella grimontii]QUE97702.1 LysR family transcriptional regulator [Klebsiella pasteurii]UHD02307.1 LysR substrate-binding domain-containing protein [Klebsiella pasteurii]